VENIFKHYNIRAQIYFARWSITTVNVSPTHYESTVHGV